MQNKLKAGIIFAISLIILNPSVICTTEDSSDFKYYISDRLYTDDHGFVICKKSDQLVNISRVYNLKNLRIGSNHWNDGYCKVPSISYGEILSRLNINVTSLEEMSLELDSQTDIVPLSSKQFLGLQTLKVLKIEYERIYLKSATSKFKVPVPSHNFLEPLTELVEFFMTDNSCPSFPNSSKITKITLEKGSSAEEFGGCLKLERLELSEWNLDKAKDKFLAHCPVLKYLKIYDMSEMSVAVAKRVLAGLKELRELKITKCFLEHLTQEDGLLSESLLIEKIDLSNNGIVEIWLPQLPQVTYLDLQFNSIENRDSILIVMNQLKNLRELNLGRNIYLNMCKQGHMEGVAVRHEKLETLSIGLTKTNELCFENLTALKRLNLEGNDLTVIDFKRIPKSRAPELVAFLAYKEITKIIFEKEDYLYIKQEISRSVKIIGLLSLQLSCDCEDGYLRRAMRDLPNFKLASPYPRDDVNIRCRDRRNLIDIPKEQIECNKYKCENCTCRSYWETNSVTADCNQAGLKLIPNIAKLTILNVSNNSIEKIGENELNGLTYLDISKNYIKNINADILKKFFTNRGRLKLAENPIECDCKNKEFLELLQINREKIEDYNALSCVDDNTLISKLDLEELCEPLVPPSAIAALAGLLAVVGLTAAAYFKYHREFKVFLYSNGCMFLVRVEELDADLRYDAFISYSHEDQEYVNETLVPGLECQPHSFNLCLHDRDWMPGHFIPAQITASVENSRRTIIIMSKKYLISPWCILEFRTAHEETLKVGRPRVIIVLLEDVITELEALDSELKSYLKNYTYLKSNDSRFWQKLRYAMPHKNRGQ